MDKTDDPEDTSISHHSMKDVHIPLPHTHNYRTNSSNIRSTLHTIIRASSSEIFALCRDSLLIPSTFMINCATFSVWESKALDIDIGLDQLKHDTRGY